MTNRTRFILLTVTVLLLGVLVWRGLNPRRPASEPVRSPSPEQVLSQPQPQMPHAPALAGSRPAPAAAPAPSAPAGAPLLSEEQLAPLRRSFVPPRFAAEPSLPRERQTLLSNRLLVTPAERILPHSASGRQTPSARNTTPFVVQFNTPVSDASRQALADIGATVRGFLPNQALLAELTPDALSRLAGVGAVQAATEFLPSDKVQPFLSSLCAAFPAASRLPVTLQTFAPEDAARVAEAVRAAGGDVSGVSSSTRWGLVRATLPLEAVRTLSARGDVQWIEERAPVATRNDQAVRAAHLNASNVWFSAGLTGKGQLIGHADTGLDTGVTNTLHADFQGNIRALIARGRPGDASDRNGHGTHTAGSILGNGASSTGQFRGVAWEAKLVHQSVVDASGYFTGLPADLYDLFAETYAYGARIHSDSWGADTYGVYDSDCRSVDLFAWDNPDHLAVFASGNSGRDDNANGVVDTGNVNSPGTAKNVLTVGAAESDRPAGSGGYSSYRYSAFTSGYPYYTRFFPLNPIYSDYVSYSATTSPYRQGMAAFSSRGPTWDGRIKPDVVAPGTDIISCRSSLGGTGWGAYAANSKYCFNGGTSMATPLIAGSAALMRQYATDRVGLARPSAALLKAMLVGGARSLTPGQYGTGASREIPAASPNAVEGWGQADLAGTVCPTNSKVCLLDRVEPAAAGQTNTFPLRVTASNTPLDVALVWIDYPATPGAAVTLVNDLDLLVVAPDGTSYHPNGAAERDTLNTVETVHLQGAQTGVYQIQVIGRSVPYSGGAAALYVRGQLAPVITHAPLAAQVANAPLAPVDFLLQPIVAPTNVAARLFWAAGNAAAPTGAWNTATAAWVTNSQYRALIPPQPPATHVHYYLEAETADGVTRLPQTAPATFSFYVDDAITLLVEGAPERIGAVNPPYGLNTAIKHVPLQASAPAVVALSNGLRRVCAGWTGTGDVPPSGAARQAELTLTQPSTLTWQWADEFALTNQFRLADTGELFGETVTWHRAGSLAETVTALELGFVDGTPYGFCGWSVDGARWPDAWSASLNPATGIPMDRSRSALGDYLPFWQDTDGNTLSDWWELRYFGSADNGWLWPDDDLDGDGWTNLGEFLDNADPLNPDSVPTPPAISVHALSPFQTQYPPWTVQAEVSDNLTVEQALLVWREKGDAAWQTNAMTYVDGTLFEAQIDPPSHGAKRVDYFVAAYDLIGYYEPLFTAFSPTNSVIGDYDYAWMEVTPASFGLLELNTASTNLPFTVANLAGPDLLWTARVAFAEATFAATNAAWAHGGVNDAWCVTTNRSWNGDAVWYCGSASMRQYPDSCHATLDTPSFLVGEGGGLLWRQWIKTEADVAPYYWDGAVVRLSADGGATFVTVTPTTGYPYLITPNPASPFAFDQPCLAGSGEGWQTLLLDLRAYAGREVIVRFEFGSDQYTTDEGWYVAGVTPFSLDAPAAAWLTPQGAWGGRLPSQWSAGPVAALDPAALAYDEEAVACVRVTGDNPADNQPLVPLTVRRGHQLNASASGPGTAKADRSFLFRNDQATLTLTAEAGAYLYAVTVNGVPLPGEYGFDTTSKTLTFANVAEDQTVQAWFTYRTWTLNVQSDFGAPTPAAGLHTLTHGTRIDATVTSPTLFAGGLSQHACSGWMLTGHSPKAGSGNAFSFALTNDALLVWTWQTNHLLTALTVENGSVAPTGGWYTAGQNACVTAYPASYYHFVTWYGDTLGGLAESNRITLPMTQPRFVIALFAQNYTPTHGVPETWLAGYGYSGDLDAAAEGDSDADGMATWQEWHADTNPTNPLSLLMLTGLLWTNQAPRLAWIGGTGRTQLVQQAAAPGGPWQTIHTNLPPTPVTNTLPRPSGAPSTFYRIAVP